MKVKIKISGKIGEGKSMLAARLRNVLAEEGFSVKSSDGGVSHHMLPAASGFFNGSKAKAKIKTKLTKSKNKKRDKATV